MAPNVGLETVNEEETHKNHIRALAGTIMSDHEGDHEGDEHEVQEEVKNHAGPDPYHPTPPGPYQNNAPPNIAPFPVAEQLALITAQLTALARAHM